MFVWGGHVIGVKPIDHTRRKRTPPLKLRQGLRHDDIISSLSHTQKISSLGLYSNMIIRAVSRLSLVRRLVISWLHIAVCCLAVICADVGGALPAMPHGGGGLFSGVLV